MKALSVYALQNAAIHEARKQLIRAGILEAESSLDQIRAMAARLNGGLASVSKLSIEQRRDLISILIGKGARVKNPTFYESDLKAEAARSGRRRRVIPLNKVTEPQQRLIDTLAAQISWPHEDSLQRLCETLFGATAPRNHSEVKRLTVVLQDIARRDNLTASNIG